MRTVDPERQAERRRQILESALACFREQGFHAAGMSAICKRANMSPGHVYHYFKSKEDIISAIVEEDGADAEARIASLLEDGNTLDAMLDRIGEIWCDSHTIRGALNAEILSESNRNPRINQILQARYRRIHKQLAGVLSTAQQRGHIAPDLDPEGFATLLYAIVDGLTVSADAGLIQDQEQATNAFRLVLNRCLRPGSQA